jgi:hypothetical protein
MATESKFYGQTLWQFFDKQISSTNFQLDYFVVKDEKSGISIPRLKMSIGPWGQPTNVSFLYQDVFTFLYQFKQVQNEFAKICKEISADINVKRNFQCKLKKNIIITFLNRQEYGGVCVRVIITDRTDDYLESEKVYLPVLDFLSLLKVMTDYRDNYLSFVSNIPSYIFLSEINEKISNLDSKISYFYSDIKFLLQAGNKLEDQNKRITSNPNVLTEYSPFSGSNSPSSCTAVGEEKILHDELDTFIDTNRDKYPIGDAIEERPKADVSQAVVTKATFTSELLKNDILNLEMYVLNAVNDDLPFSKFISLIQSKLSFDPLAGISQINKVALNYVVSSYIKFYVKDNIENKRKLPPNVSPVILDDFLVTNESLSVMYDLLLYFIYYTQLKNVIEDKDHNPYQNREFVCFCLKSLGSPLVFSLTVQSDEGTLVSEIRNRLRKYKEAGVFHNLENQIKDKYGILFDLNEETVINEVKRVYNAVKAGRERMLLSTIFKKFDILTLKYEDFIKNNFQDEQIKKLLAIEFNIRQNKTLNFDKLPFKGIDDLPAEILEHFGIGQKKYDNTNLLRYVKDACKDSGEQVIKLAMEIVSCVNESHRDLRGKNFDYILLPEDALKAIFLWDLDRDKKMSINFMHFRDTVQASSLTKDMVISFLNNIQDTIDADVLGQFLAAKDEQ